MSATTHQQRNSEATLLHHLPVPRSNERTNTVGIVGDLWYASSHHSAAELARTAQGHYHMKVSDVHRGGVYELELFLDDALVETGGFDCLPSLAEGGATIPRPCQENPAPDLTTETVAKFLFDTHTVSCGSSEENEKRFLTEKCNRFAAWYLRGIDLLHQNSAATIVHERFAFERATFLDTLPQERVRYSVFAMEGSNSGTRVSITFPLFLHCRTPPLASLLDLWQLNGTTPLSVDLSQSQTEFSATVEMDLHANGAHSLRLKTIDVSITAASIKQQLQQEDQANATTTPEVAAEAKRSLQLLEKYITSLINHPSLKHRRPQAASDTTLVDFAPQTEAFLEVSVFQSVERWLTLMTAMQGVFGPPVNCGTTSGNNTTSANRSIYTDLRISRYANYLVVDEATELTVILSVTAPPLGAIAMTHDPSQRHQSPTPGVGTAAAMFGINTTVANQTPVGTVPLPTVTFTSAQFSNGENPVALHWTPADHDVQRWCHLEKLRRDGGGNENGGGGGGGGYEGEVACSILEYLRRNIPAMLQAAKQR